MSDATSVTNPLAKGVDTSEGRLTIISVVGGMLLSIFGALQPLLVDAQQQFPQNRWVAIGAMLCGAAISVGSLFGYNKGRALLKSTQVAGLLQAGGPVVASLMQSAINKAVGPGPLSAETPTPNVLLRPPIVPPYQPPTARP